LRALVKDGRILLKLILENSVKIWIGLKWLKRVKWWAFVKPLMDLRVP
jgi:hypothetical protein